MNYAIQTLMFGCILITASHGQIESYTPSQIASQNFQGDGGLSFRVDFDKVWPTLKRTSNLLPVPRQIPPAYQGAAHAIFTIVFDAEPPQKPQIEQKAWDYQRAAYSLGSGGNASIVFNRLSPAVLLETEAKEISFRPGADEDENYVRYIAFIRAGKPVIYPVEKLSQIERFDMDEPWVLTWFGSATPVRGYAVPNDVDDEEGVDKPRIMSGEFDALDLPVLFRLERRMESISIDSNKHLTFRFEKPAGKIALMPLMGGKILLPSETEGWRDGLPDDVLQQCRLWSARLRDYPLSVKETFSVDTGNVGPPTAGERKKNDLLTVKQDLQWISFQDDWGSPAVKAAPIPPMLALALGGGVPVKFYREGEEVQPVDYNYMDTAGRAMGIEGADAWEYRITGLGKYLRAQQERHRSQVPARVLPIISKLENHIEDMIDAGHLAPLFYIYGGIGGTWFSHYYWVGSPELAHALSMAYPYLSDDLQAKVMAYLRAEWRAYKPFQLEQSHYEQGTPRMPYDIPLEDIGAHINRPITRDMAYRRSDYLHDLYGIHQYYELTGDEPDVDRLREQAANLSREFIAHQDWAIMGPSRLENVTSHLSIRYFNLQGQATYNRWLAGAIGLTRLASKYGWQAEEELGWYLSGKLAIARIAQARYVSEMHRMGLVRGPLEDDPRTLLHIDTTCAIVGRGPVTSVVFEDQEAPPFIDLVEEVGMLLGDYAEDECRIYLDYLDRAMPLWYISEAPKQSATEHRTSPLQHLNGNVLAQSWVLGKRGKEFMRYVDTTRFKGDLYYIQNMAAGLDSYTKTEKP